MCINSVIQTCTALLVVRLVGQDARREHDRCIALVVPHNGDSYARDPSHTGTNSVNIRTQLASGTAIVGVSTPDTLVVGPVLNTAAVVYDVFVIGGTGNGVFYPVAPIVRPTPGPWLQAPTPPPSPGIACFTPSDPASTSGQGCASAALP